MAGTGRSLNPNEAGVPTRKINPAFRAAIAKKGARIAHVSNAVRQRVRSTRRDAPSPRAWSASVLTYALGSVAVAAIDQGFLLVAWLMCGPLAVTVYLTFDDHHSLLNAYTLFFSAIVLGCLAGYFYY